MEDIVPPHLAIKAMQDNGYKNAAYAIAELIDNSIEAGATLIELLCVEDVEIVMSRKRSRIKEIAILDNGSGMTADNLKMSLQFGNGTHLGGKATGIGKFGMGLPSSSISQCQRVEVWTWKNGPESAIYSYLDVDAIQKKELGKIPDPIAKNIPEQWLKMGRKFGKTGTLVVWTKLERCFWRTAMAIIDNSEQLIGRIYRRFIYDGTIKIRLAAYDRDNLDKADFDELAQPNDPLYLLDKTSCPEPFADAAMFEPWGEPRIIEIGFNGGRHKVTLRFSHAKKEARPDDQSGRLPHGRHAAKNIGVSLVRSGRELELDESWTIGYDPIDRWWGAEIEFPPALDGLFGVTNNKQAARYFSEMSKLNVDQLLRETGKTLPELRDDWADVGDPRGPLLEISQIVRNNISTLRDLLKKAEKGKRKQQRHMLAQQQATDATKVRQEEGHKGASDDAEQEPKDKRIAELSEDIAQDIAEGEVPTAEEAEKAQELAAELINRGFKFEIVESAMETDAFFSVKPVAGVLKVVLNTDHPAYTKLVEALKKPVSGATLDQLKERLLNAGDGLELLLTAWARYEDEQVTAKRREDAKNTRTDWGRVARQFLTINDE